MLLYYNQSDGTLLLITSLLKRRWEQVSSLYVLSTLKQLLLLAVCEVDMLINQTPFWKQVFYRGALSFTVKTVVITLQSRFLDSLQSAYTVGSHVIHSVTSWNKLWWSVWHSRTHVDGPGSLCGRPEATDLFFNHLHPTVVVIQKSRCQPFSRIHPLGTLNEPDVVTVHPVAVRILQSGPKCLTEKQTDRHSQMSAASVKHPVTCVRNPK